MVISSSVREQFFGSASTTHSHRVIRVESSQTSPLDEATMIERRIGLPWTKAEHERFLEGLELYPTGPWKLVAEYVGTRTTRQTMTHAQKYRQKIGRQLNRSEHESKDTTQKATPHAQNHGQERPRSTIRGRNNKKPPTLRRPDAERSSIDAQFDALWAQALPNTALSSSTVLPMPLEAPPQPLSGEDSHALLSLFQAPVHVRAPEIHETFTTGYHGHTWTVVYSPLQLDGEPPELSRIV